MIPSMTPELLSHRKSIHRYRDANDAIDEGIHCAENLEAKTIKITLPNEFEEAELMGSRVLCSEPSHPKEVQPLDLNTQRWRLF